MLRPELESRGVCTLSVSETHRLQPAWVSLGWGRAEVTGVAEAGGRGRPVEQNVFRSLPLSSCTLAIERDFTNILEGILQFRVSRMRPPGLRF